MSAPKSKAPKVRVVAVGTVLNPGDPGYDDALARIKAQREAAGRPTDQSTKKKEIEA